MSQSGRKPLWSRRRAVAGSELYVFVGYSVRHRSPRPIGGRFEYRIKSIDKGSSGTVGEGGSCPRGTTSLAVPCGDPDWVGATSFVSSGFSTPVRSWREPLVVSAVRAIDVGS
jgi:hypothetical protein